MKRVYIHTFGCQMNEYDSSRMEGLLDMVGYSQSASPDEADLIIVNTCSVREKPEQKVFSLLGRLRKEKERRGTLLAVGGCVAQQIGKEIFDKAPYVDIVFGTHNVDSLPEMVVEAEKGLSNLFGIDMGEAPSTFEVTQRVKVGAVKAYVTIMQGCENFCTYCIVPLVRGKEYSRPSSGIISEIRELAGAGVREVTLLGQNVNSYGLKNGDISFPELLRLVSHIDGIQRIRFVTSHPRDFSDELVGCFKEVEKLCPHVHLPAQSGSDRILSRMGRGYDRARYIEIVEKLKGERFGMTFSSDFIVGFPGESEADFEDTLGLIESLRYDNSFSFKFSPRPGTEAANYKDQVKEEDKKERLVELQSLQKRITLENYAEYVDKNVEVLVEGESKRDNNRYTGRTCCNKVVNFDGGCDRVGQFVSVAVTDAFSNSLTGVIAGGG